MLFSQKKNDVRTHASHMDEAQTHYTMWKKQITKGYRLYGPIYVKCPQEANPERQQVDHWVPRAECKVGWKVATKKYEVFFWSNENILNSDYGDGCITL